MDRQDYYRRLIAAQEKSGKSVREFCRSRNLSAWTFYSWRKRPAEVNVPEKAGGGFGASQGFVRVALGQEASFQSPESSIEVLLDSGTVIRFPETLDTSRMTEITQALRNGLK